MALASQPKPLHACHRRGGLELEGACNACDHPLDFRTVRTYIGHVERPPNRCRTFEEDR